jgi:phenylpropionate dioxygenase-like ring-hydroxylating dioxygenase large terminal subunit
MADINSGGMAMAGNPYPITRPDLIPAQRYYDEAFYRAEVEHLWGHAWQMACRLEMIPNVGDWVEYANVGKSVLIVRTESGVKAYQNHCRHRGVPVAGGSGSAHGNCAQSGFICPFHGWRWNMDGESTFVYGKEMFSQDLMDHAELALKPVRCEIWGGCAFITHDANAPALKECLGPVLDRLDMRNMSDVRSEWWFATEIPANWKIAMEAFMEGYHVMMTHPQLQRSAPLLYNTRYGDDTGGIGPQIDPELTVADAVLAQMDNCRLLNEGMSGLVHSKEIAIMDELGPDKVQLPPSLAEAIPTWFGIVQEAISRKLKERGENVPDLNECSVKAPVNAVEFLFPNYFLLPFFTSFASYRIRPLGPEKCRFEIWSLTHFPKGQEPEPPMEPIVLPYDSQDFPMIPRQDYSNIPIQQIGLHSEGFEFMRLAEGVEGLISNYQRLIDGYIAGEPGAKLAAANQKLGGNFDGKIEDLGF